MKLNVAALVRRPPLTFEKAFRLRQANRDISLKFVANDAIRSYQSQDLCRQMVRRYIVEETPFLPFGDGADFEITESLIESVAPVCILHVPESEAEAYSFEEWVWIAACEPEMWGEILTFLYQKCGESVSGEDTHLGNASAPAQNS
jgi:hypothetical protein